MLESMNPTAVELKDTGLWDRGTKANRTIKVKGDKNRVNIVSEDLVDDVLKYLGEPFKEAYKGCDIIDLYPGVGVWSSKLNALLEPETHILMEPDRQLYTPFLRELLARDGVRLVPKSGIIWRNLTSVLTKEYLPRQVELVSGESSDAGVDMVTKLARKGSKSKTTATDEATLATDEATQNASTEDIKAAVEMGSDLAARAIDAMKEKDASASSTANPKTDAQDDDPANTLNNTLLVTANLAFFPRRRFNNFESVSQLVLFQFISAIRSNSLFHKYGLVRMLIWVEENDRHALVARSVQRRRRLAIDGELSCSTINEVCGPDVPPKSYFLRDRKLDLESCRRALAHMKLRKVSIPEGRETALVKEVRAMEEAGESIDFTEGPEFMRVYYEELDKLSEKCKLTKADLKAMEVHERLFNDEEGEDAIGPNEDNGPFDSPYSNLSFDKVMLGISGTSETRKLEKHKAQAKAAMKAVVAKAHQSGVSEKDFQRFMTLTFRKRREARLSDMLAQVFEAMDDIERRLSKVRGETGLKLARRHEKHWNEVIDRLASNDRREFILHRDNRHLFKQAAFYLNGEKFMRTYRSRPVLNGKPIDFSNWHPVLSWDRRTREPLTVDKDEFFPRVPLVLMDIQPKAVNPALRAMSSGTTRSGDHFELVQRAMLMIPALTIAKALESVWPGAAEGVLPNCPSLRDMQKGGTMLTCENGQQTVRTLNERQWIEIIEAWMKWPFRPTLGQLAVRVFEEGFDQNDEDENQSLRQDP